MKWSVRWSRDNCSESVVSLSAVTNTILKIYLLLLNPSIKAHKTAVVEPPGLGIMINEIRMISCLAAFRIPVFKFQYNVLLENLQLWILLRKTLHCTERRCFLNSNARSQEYSTHYTICRVNTSISTEQWSLPGNITCASHVPISYGRVAGAIFQSQRVGQCGTRTCNLRDGSTAVHSLTP